jgi:hypothetical protein
MDGLDKLYEYLAQRFDKLEDRVTDIDKKMVAIETKNTLISAAVAFVVVNFQNVVSFFKDKHS